MAQTHTAPSKRMERRAQRRTDWTRGRLVVIRPDVPGKHCDPEHSQIIRSDEDRAAMHVAFHSLAEQARERHGKPPDWLEHVDEWIVPPSSSVNGNGAVSDGPSHTASE